MSLPSRRLRVIGVSVTSLHDLMEDAPDVVEVSLFRFSNRYHSSFFWMPFIFLNVRTNIYVVARSASILPPVQVRFAGFHESGYLSSTFLNIEVW
jgi:hypothetical protein